MTKKAQLYRVEPENSKGLTVRRAVIAATRTAKDGNASGVAIVIVHANGDVSSHFAGLTWLERVGALEVAKNS